MGIGSSQGGGQACQYLASLNWKLRKAGGVIHIKAGGLKGEKC